MGYKKYEKIAEILKAVAHPARLCILKGLTERERGVNEMCGCLSAPQPTISLHLSKLKSAGLIEGVRQGNAIIYRVKDERLVRMIVALTEQ